MNEAGMRYLLEAYSAGSMRAAGDRLNIAPSSISRQIAQLEADFGLSLVEKGRRGIRLTHAGEIVVDHYRNQLADREALKSRLDDLRSVRTGNVTIAVGEGFLGQSFTSLISHFAEENPQISLDIRTGATQEILRQIADDEAHVGLVFQTPHDLKLQVRAAIAQPLMAIVRADHALAKRGSVTLEELCDQPLCLPPAHFRIRQILGSAESGRNRKIEPSICTNSIAVMLQSVKAGIACTILPEVSAWAELEAGEMVSIPIDDNGLEGTTVSLVLRSGRQLEGAPVKMLKRLEAQLRRWNGPVSLRPAEQ
ncbi:LysR family transcriptional regulator [Aurantiacibacter suaedae]|uniref:LysR family transcriptional regulator n=1 Tax=Aurantiacibacter suaedae TaxID=2545755 RepID=UPI001F4F6FB6|nr:LysR family transcriptional regulator [Aurantiacibacter suaedae]